MRTSLNPSSPSTSARDAGPHPTNAVATQPSPSSPPVIVVTHEHRRRMIAHALAEYPSECCGLLIGTVRGSRNTVEHVVPCENVHPGHRQTRFQIDPHTLFEAIRAARAAGRQMIGFYHSHPNGSAAPSRYDQRTAWPDCSHVIIATERESAGDLRSWRCIVGVREMEPERIAPCNASAVVS